MIKFLAKGIYIPKELYGKYCNNAIKRAGIPIEITVTQSNVQFFLSIICRINLGNRNNIPIIIGNIVANHMTGIKLKVAIASFFKYA
jgi:hypothetical protein